MLVLILINISNSNDINIDVNICVNKSVFTIPDLGNDITVMNKCKNSLTHIVSIYHNVKKFVAVVMIRQHNVDISYSHNINL